MNQHHPTLKDSHDLLGDSQVDGPLFFTSANRLVKLLDPSRDPEEVELRFGETTLMDFTSVETLHKIALNYKNEGGGTMKPGKKMIDDGDEVRNCCKESR